MATTLVKDLRPKLALTAVFLLSILLLAACGDGKEKDRQILVPEGSNLIAGIQLSQILEDEDLAALFSRIPKDEDDSQTLDQLLDKAAEEIGVELRNFSRIVLFGDVSRFEDTIAAIAQGSSSLDEDLLVETLAKANDWTFTTTEYKEHQIHVNEEGRVESDGLEAISFLGSDSLVLGSLESVKAVIDVQEGDKDRASGVVYDSFNDLGDGLVRLVLEVPPEAVKDIGLPIPGFPVDAGFLREIKVVGILVDKDGQNITLEARGDFTDKSAASNFGDVVEGLLKLAGGLTSDEGTKELVKDVRVSVDESRLRVVSQISLTQLEELVLGTGDGFLGSFLPFREEGEAPPPVIERGAVPAIPTPEPQAVAPIVPSEGAVQVPTLDAHHIPAGETASYSTVPPTSGPHWPATAQCGAYDEELPDELVVHNMEHGHVIISHNLPDPDQLRMMKELAEGLPGLAEWAVVRPYSKIRPGTVAMTAWGVMDQISGVDEERIIRFYRTYIHNRLSLETQQVGPIPCR